MSVKLIVIILFLLIVVNLGSALFFMLKDKGQNKRTVNALTWRIGLSVLVFICLLIAYALGFIEPHGIMPVNPQ